MSEAETSVAALVQANAESEKPRITVVTPDNFDAYVSEKLPPKMEDPETAAAAEFEKVEAEKAGRTEEIDHPDEKKKGRLNARFSELTEARKAAEEKATKAADEARVAREEREAVARERDELKAKYEPVKTEQDPEPVRTQFASDEDFASALKEWTTDNVRREDAKKDAVAKATKAHNDMVNAWQSRVEEYQKANPEYAKKVSESKVVVSDQVQQAILESEFGPQLLEHLADNEDFAVELREMTVSKALRALGRIEAGFEKAQTKETKAPSKISEISRAPAPISPLKNASNPVVRLSGHDDVPANMTYDTWKAYRQAGKIH